MTKPMIATFPLDVASMYTAVGLELATSRRRAIDHLLLERISVVEPSLAVHPQRALMECEVRAFESLYDTLWQNYPEEFVAIHRGKLIDIIFDVSSQ